MEEGDCVSRFEGDIHVGDEPVLRPRELVDSYSYFDRPS